MSPALRSTRSDKYLGDTLVLGFELRQSRRSAVADDLWNLPIGITHRKRQEPALFERGNEALTLLWCGSLHTPSDRVEKRFLEDNTLLKQT